MTATARRAAARPAPSEPRSRGVDPAAIALPPTVSVDLTVLVEARLPADATPSGATRAA